MKTIGIIAEYNPFHNGHAYQLAKAKAETGADYCIVVMSGNFVQRGAPALMDKYIRAEAALLNGADLVLELPVYYSLASAEYFASGAVALFDKLSVVDTLCFGSECGDINLLSDFASQLLQEDEVFKETLQRCLRHGDSYPTARNTALQASAPHLTGYMDVLTSPNNILGIEYCKALIRRNSKITPSTITRNGAAYHDASLDAGYCSALAIRESLLESGNLSLSQEQVPASAYELMQKHYGITYPVASDDASALLHYQLLTEQKEGFTSHPDIDKELSDRIIKKLPEYTTFSAFCETLKTKNRTYTRISRSLMHILLHMTARELADYRASDYIHYARILGFKESALPLLNAIKKNSQVPLISKLADAGSYVSELGMQMLDKDIYASSIYQMLVQRNFPDTYSWDKHNEFKKQMLKV